MFSHIVAQAHVVYLRCLQLRICGGIRRKWLCQCLLVQCAALLCDTMHFFYKYKYFSPPTRLVFIPLMPVEVQLTVCPALLGLVGVIASWSKRECDATFIT